MTKPKNLLQFEQVKANKIGTEEYAARQPPPAAFFSNAGCDPLDIFSLAVKTSRTFVLRPPSSESEIVHLPLCVIQRDDSMQHVTDNH